MLSPLSAAVARTIDIVTPTSSMDISEVNTYTYSYYATSSCQTQPMYIEAISDSSSSDILLLCSGAMSYQSISTAITYDGITSNAASLSSGGISALPILDFDAISTDNSWYVLVLVLILSLMAWSCLPFIVYYNQRNVSRNRYGWYDITGFFGGPLSYSSQQSLNIALAPKMSALSWLWAINPNILLSATQQYAAIDISPITFGTNTLTPLRSHFLLPISDNM
jgi:hypothetical protein